VNLAILSNALPPDGTAVLQRSSVSLAAVVATEACAGAAPVPLFVNDPAVWAEVPGNLDLHPTASFDAVFGGLLGAANGNSGD